MPVLYGAIVLPHFCRTVNDVLEDLGKPYKAVLMDNGSTAEGFMQDIVTNKPDLAKCAVLSQRWVSRSMTAGMSLPHGQAIVVIAAERSDAPGMIPAYFRHREGRYELPYDVRIVCKRSHLT